MNGNQRLPSGPTVMFPTDAFFSTFRGNVNVSIWPAARDLPDDSVVVVRFRIGHVSVNQTLPSGPAVMYAEVLFGSGYMVIVPVVVIRPIEHVGS